jgi:uncharacterized protein YdaU (DUF1376 family)
MHYYQFNIGDYKSHTEHLSEMEDLAYRRLLDWYYLHESPIPLDVDEVSRQIRMRSHTESIAVVLREFFEQTKKGWVSHRANIEIAKAGEKSTKAKASAKARWNKEKDANALPAQSEGNATQDTVHKTQDTKHKKTVANTVACPSSVEQQVWSDWLAIRKAKRLPLTETAWDQMRGEIETAGLTVDVVIKECCLRGWASFKANWLKDNPITTAPADRFAGDI